MEIKRIRIFKALKDRERKKGKKRPIEELKGREEGRKEREILGKEIWEEREIV